MSRVGRKPIPLPQGVKITVADGVFTAEGPKGKVSQTLLPGFPVKVESGVVSVEREGDSGPERSKHGLIRSLLANAVEEFRRASARGSRSSGWATKPK